MERRTQAVLFAAGAVAILALASVAVDRGGERPSVVQPAAAHPVSAAAPAAAPGAAPGAAIAVVDPPPAAPPGLDALRPDDCLIEPSRVVRVNSGVEGVIESIRVDRGDLVHKGEIVATLRADVDRATAAAAGARAANVHTEQAAAARASYLAAVRQRSEEVRAYIARDKLEEAEANARAAAEEQRAAVQERRVAQLEYDRSQRILAEKLVRSPIDGIVTERAMSVGEYRGPNAAHILTIAQVNPLHVEVFAPISELASFKVGSQLAILPEEPVGGRYLATVKVIDRVFDAASGTFGMRLELPNPGNALPAGLRCRIEGSSRTAQSPADPPTTPLMPAKEARP